VLRSSALTAYCFGRRSRQARRLGQRLVSTVVLFVRSGTRIFFQFRLGSLFPISEGRIMGLVVGMYLVVWSGYEVCDDISLANWWLPHCLLSE
jgi:hypothetical protein